MKKVFLLALLLLLLLLLAGCKPVSTTIPQATALHAPSTCDVTQAGIIEPDGIKYTVIGTPDFIKQVRCVMNDDRFWSGLKYVDFGADFTIRSIDPDEVESICGKPYPTEAENQMVSCSDTGIVVLNSVSWNSGVNVRILGLSHEVGHQLGHDHDYGAPCSVMHAAETCGVLWPPIKDSKIAKN